MANNDTPNGLKPIGSIAGAPYSGEVIECYIPSTDSDGDVYVGDVVKLAGSADVSGVPTVSGAITTGGDVFGVVTAVLPDTRESLTYRADDTSRYVLVAPVTNEALFVVQDDGTGTPSAGWVGSVADLTGFGTGSTISGQSYVEISGSTVTASGDGTEDVVIVGAYRVPDNDITSDYAKWIVRLNNIQLIDAFTGT